VATNNLVNTLDGLSGTVVLNQGTGIAITDNSPSAGHITIANAGVTSLTNGNGIALNANTGAVTISNSGVTSIVNGSTNTVFTGQVTFVGGTGIVISPNVPVSGSLTISISGSSLVSSLDGIQGAVTLTQGAGISIVDNSPSSGRITLTNTGVTSVIPGSGISINQSTGAVTISVSGTTGVSSIVNAATNHTYTGTVGLNPGTGVSFSDNVPVSGYMSISIGQNVATNANVQFNSSTLSVGETINGSGWNSLTTLGGIDVLGALQVGPGWAGMGDQGALGNKFLIQGAGSGIVSYVLDAFDGFGGAGFTTANIIGRYLRASSYTSGYQATPSGSFLMTFGGRGSFSGGVTTSNSAAISFVTTESWNFSTDVGAEIQFATTPNGSSTSGRLTRMYIRNNGLVEVAGVSGSAGMQLDTGWFQATDGVSGGFLAQGNTYNIIQAPNGGLYSGQAVYLRALGGTTPNGPPGGVGAIGYSSGSNYWIWNGSSYASVNLTAVGGGVTAINGMAGSITIAQGSGISISSGSQQVTITNSGVTFLSQGSGITLSGSTGSITISAAGVTAIVNASTNHAYTGSVGISAGSNIILSDNIPVSGFMLISVSSTPSFTTVSIGGTQAINSSAQFVGNGVNVGMNGVSARAFNPKNSSGTQFFGSDLTFVDLNGITHTVIGGIVVA